MTHRTTHRDHSRTGDSHDLAERRSGLGFSTVFRVTAQLRQGATVHARGVAFAGQLTFSDQIRCSTGRCSHRTSCLQRRRPTAAGVLEVEAAIARTGGWMTRRGSR
jgi:hypothetical protein